MAKKKQPKKSLLGSLKNIIGGPPSDAQYAKNLAKSRKRSKPNASRRDLLAPFQLPMLDLDPLVHPTKNNSPRIPPKLNLGTLLRQAGSTNIYRETLLLDSNIFYKFTQDMPYAHTGKFRSYIHTGQIVLLNTFRKGTFSVELGGNKIEVSDLDLEAEWKVHPYVDEGEEEEEEVPSEVLEENEEDLEDLPFDTSTRA